MTNKNGKDTLRNGHSSGASSTFTHDLKDDLGKSGQALMNKGKELSEQLGTKSQEFMHRSEEQIKQHPVAAIAVAFTTGCLLSAWIARSFTKRS